MAKMNVEVVYALPDRQFLRQVEIEQGSNIEQAVIASGLLALRNDIDLHVNKVGIFGRAAKLMDTLKEGDRVEIYRPLIADPKEMRRLRAQKVKDKKEGA